MEAKHGVREKKSGNIKNWKSYNEGHVWNKPMD